MSEGQGQAPSARWRRFLWAILPIGIVLMITWVVVLAVDIADGDSQRGISITSAMFGLVTWLTLIVSGLYYRRALRRE